MKPGAAAVRELFRVGFDRLQTCDPADVDEVVLAIIGSLRAMRPEQFGCLSTLPEPGEVARDPRT